MTIILAIPTAFYTLVLIIKLDLSASLLRGATVPWKQLYFVDQWQTLKLLFCCGGWPSSLIRDLQHVLLEEEEEEGELIKSLGNKNRIWSLRTVRKSFIDLIGFDIINYL